MTAKSPPKLGNVTLDRSKPYCRILSISTGKLAEKHLGPARQKLTQSLSVAWDAYQGSSDSGRRGVRIAIAAACEFIEAADTQCGEMFDRFNTVLVAALHNLDRGVTAPLLTSTAKYGRKTDSFAYRDVQRRAVATMAGLMDVGYARDDAAKTVATTLGENGFRTTRRAVEKWYDERLPADVKPRKGRPPKSAPDKETKSAPDEEDDDGKINAYLHHVVIAAQSHRKKRRDKFLLDELTWFIRLWFPSPR
jgi:hypothetical protein